MQAKTSYPDQVNTPLVSVIVPNYNHAAYLQQRLESVAHQTYSNFEIILLDDCSSDNSREIMESWRRHPKCTHILYNDKNSGSAFSQWNKGIALSKGTLIWVAESDDACDSTFLEKAVKKMTEFPTAGLVYAQNLEIDETGDRGGISFYDHPGLKDAFTQSYFKTGRKEIREKLVYENTILNASGVLFKKSVYIACGGADESMRLCGDWMLWVKMLLISDLFFIAEPLNYFRLTPASLRNTVSFMDSFHERLKVIHFLKENGIAEATQSEQKLILKLFNNYTVPEFYKPVQLIAKEKALLSHPFMKIIKGTFSSVAGKIKYKLSIH